MKHLLTITLILLCFTVNAQLLVPQTKQVTDKYFPDKELDLDTPAFQKKKGFTNYEDLMGFLDRAVKAHPNKISYEFIGKSQKGKDIPLVRFSKSSNSENSVKFWIQAGIHGNEPASTEGILYLITQLLNNPEHAELLNNIELAIIPMANIDGYEKQDRYAANGLDLNRDQTKLMVHESPILKQAFSDFNADVAMDFHEYRPYRRDYQQLNNWGITSPYDVMFLYSSNLNVPKNLRDYTKNTFVESAKSALDKEQLRHHDYFSATKHFGEIRLSEGSLNSRSSATSYALTNCISTLIEVRGVALDKTSFKRRIVCTYTVALSYLTTAANNIDEVKSAVLEARDNSDAPVVVKMKKKVEGRLVPMLDLETNEIMDLDIVVEDALYATSTLERERPYAYVILPGNEHILSKLSTLGLKYETLKNSQTTEVETYTVSNYFIDPEEYEGVYRQKIETVINTTQKEIPAGSAIVYMNQRKANLVIEVLEPEAINSFVSFNVLPTSLGEELPIYRYLINTNL